MKKLAQLIQRNLKDEYLNGATFKELEKKYGVAYSYIRSLMNGDKPITRMSLEVFLKLFPGIENVISEHISGAAGGHTAIDHIIAGNNIQASPAADLDAYRGRLYSAILGLGLDPQTQDRVMQAVRGTR